MRTRHENNICAWALEQEQPSGERSKLVRVMEPNRKPPEPEVVLNYVSYGRNYPVTTRFDELKFFIKIDNLLKKLNYGNVAPEVLDFIKTIAILYAQKCRKQAVKRALKTTMCFLRDNGFIAVPFDKGLGICIMKKATYHEKLPLITESAQFLEFKEDT